MIPPAPAPAGIYLAVLKAEGVAFIFEDDRVWHYFSDRPGEAEFIRLLGDDLAEALTEEFGVPLTIRPP